jgi:sigma-E factor negative regulatory protein RseC
MREAGIVTKLISPDRAVIEMVGSGACQKCRACTFLAGSGKMVMEAQNGIGAQVGDRVEVCIPGKSVVWFSFLVYIFPLIGLAVGYWIGAAGWSALSAAQSHGWFAAGRATELAGIICGFLGMGLFFGLVSVYDKRQRSKRDGARLTKIM